MKVLAVDLETIANRALISILPEIKSKIKKSDQYKDEISNLIDQADRYAIAGKSTKAIETKIFKLEDAMKNSASAINFDISKQKKDQIKKMGLDPMLNMICCAGYCSDDGPGSIMLADETAESESRLIEKFWVVASQYDHFVTFNGRPFDFRCLHLHGTKHNIMPSINIDKGKYNRGNHTDLRQVFYGSDTFAKGKLEFIAQHFLGRGKTEGIDGAMVQDYWDIGLHDDIEKYCEEDCQITYDLYKVAEAGGLLE